MIVYGLIIMVVGMGTVLLFLGLQVLMMQASAAFFGHFADRFADTPPVGGHLETLVSDHGAHLAVALAAIHVHRQKL